MMKDVKLKSEKQCFSLNSPHKRGRESLIVSPGMILKAFIGKYTCTIMHEEGCKYYIPKSDFEKHFVIINNQKPPIGIRPRWLVSAERLDEINEAMKRYTLCHKEIPQEWLDERKELLDWLNEFKKLEVKR